MRLRPTAVAASMWYSPHDLAVSAGGDISCTCHHSFVSGVRWCVSVHTAALWLEFQKRMWMAMPHCRVWFIGMVRMSAGMACT
jgi:hypothetical protein